MQPADLVVEHADLLATCAGPAPRRGPRQREVTPLRDAVVAAHAGRIVYVGPASGLETAVRLTPDAVRIDASGATVLPGFVDAHTHAVYAGDRRDELPRRLAGATFADVAAAGGGIARTVRATRAASEADLVATGRRHLDEMIGCGTTLCEIKSGYGLSLDAELRQLRAIAALGEAHAIDVVSTFLGAHDLPEEYRGRPDDYVTLVVEQMLPAVAAAGTAEWCDVFCDPCAFDADQSERVLRAGLAAGLKPRIHADEFGPAGGARVAAAVGARAADHLVHAGDADAEALAAAGVCAVLLPIAALSLKLGRFAPARLLVDRGVAVALGTDLNPGAGLSPSMPFAVALACFAMDLTLEEALVAATLNAAWSLDRADVAGSLEPGKLMDAVVVDGDLTSLLRIGVPAIRTVIKAGRIVAERAA